MKNTKLLIYLLASALAVSSITNIYYYSNEADQVAAVEELRQIKEILKRQEVEKLAKKEAWKKMTTPQSKTNTNDGENWNKKLF